jgi:NADPH:quinone reductase-like Zn-dependent oxidoreductase
VDVVIDGVGEATAEHSQRSLNPGGRWVVAGGTSGTRAAIDIGRLFWRELQIIGVTMGTIEDLTQLLAFLERSRLRPRIGNIYQGIDEVPVALASLLDGSARGKLVVEF